VAKVNAPLFSFSASGALAKALVYFGWKGLDVVRSYTVPANPKTAAQTTHRGRLTAAVAGVHTMMADTTNPLGEVDKTAYAELARTRATVRTWFNEAVKLWVDQLVAALTGSVYGDPTLTPSANTITVSLWESGGTASGGDFWYGTSPTALLHSQVDVPAAQEHTAVIAGLTTAVKYFIQYRPTAPAGSVGAVSGIYYAVAG